MTTGRHKPPLALFPPQKPYNLVNSLATLGGIRSLDINVTVFKRTKGKADSWVDGRVDYTYYTMSIIKDYLKNIAKQSKRWTAMRGWIN